ncbi:MAG: DNA replication/repair protein RecF [Acidimicrobiia bacterium]|nr:DNA replication/repair protein RecF [Acidimicrobiia bacterium]
MRIERLWLTDFRNYAAADLELAPGLTVVLGRNGQGKSNLLEAVSYLATLGSFRGAPTDALIRAGADRAIIRAEGEREGRRLLIEVELARNGRHRVQLNRQRLRRNADLLGAFHCTVFAPDDLALLKEGPAVRRRYLDDALVALDPRREADQRELDRVLRQRNALLRQVGGRLDEAAALTLDVWDDKLATVGERVAGARHELVTELSPEVSLAYEHLAGRRHDLALRYERSWPAEPGLAAALAASRRDDVRRGVSTVGPHRDELAIELSGLVARACASQGEQRTLALALKLAAHRLVAAALGSPPLLLLDDVFSELDPQRCAALLAHLPAGQAMLTSADRMPTGSEPEHVYDVSDGRVTVRADSPLPHADGPISRAEGQSSQPAESLDHGAQTW